MSKGSAKVDQKRLYITVAVAALGYFVDIYDLLLFGIVRVPSLKALGVPEDQLLSVGIDLINSQMAGLLTGGILWGILGDKKGRLSVLFGSIFLYSLANIANAFVKDPQTYALLRFIAGIGLAGELGAAITLVSEVMPKETRGIGTTIVASFGILGAVVAALIGDKFDWQTAYIIGGLMGLALLVLRFRMLESGMYDAVAKAESVKKGAFLSLFTDWARVSRYANCILIGVPIWFVIGILVTFSPELAKEIGIPEPIKAGTSIMAAYIGLSLGDLASGLMSQVFKSRRKVVGGFMTLTLVGVLIYVFIREISAREFYVLCGVLGFSVGYWAVFVTVAAEQFGTNLRSTVATSVPNFVRGSVVPLTLSFNALKPQWGLLHSALIVGLVSLAIATWALWHLKETFGKDLDYVDHL